MLLGQNLQNELRFHVPITAETTAESVVLGMDADCKLYQYRQKPDVTVFGPLIRGQNRSSHL